MARICPDCDLPLEPQVHEGVTLDVCTGCAGIFFDDGELNQLRKQGVDRLAAIDANVQPTVEQVPSEPGLRLCPNCRISMDRYRYLYTSHIMLDSCDTCGGVWAQNGELKAMRDVLEAESNEPNCVHVQAQLAIASAEARRQVAVAQVERVRSMATFMARAAFRGHFH